MNLFDKSPLVILEEPERNIHPSLMAKVVNLLRDASEHKQIIVTTHNPQIVRYMELDDLLLMTRDAQGTSKISRPADHEHVRTFLMNDIGLDDLFVQNLLGE